MRIRSRGPLRRRLGPALAGLTGALLLVLASSGPTAAGDAPEDAPTGDAPIGNARTGDAAIRFERANAAFGAGRYADAIAGFEAILEQDGGSAALLFNLANANFRAGRIGQAILSYERALLLAPRDPDVRTNLRRAREAASLPVAEDTTWTRFVRLLSANGWAWLASAGLYLACGALLALRLPGDDAARGAARRAARFAAVAGATLVVVAGGACLARLRELDRGVVLASDPRLRVAPYGSATVSSELAPGEIVRIEREHAGFALVRTAQGRSGWVAGVSVAPIAPPAP